MCFSATASFVAGGVLSVGGVITTAQAKTKRELPFALVPLLFGIQQLTEGFVWLSFGWHAATLNLVATYIFSLFAFVIWPIYVPFTLGLLETVSWRKKAVFVCQAAGLAVGLYLYYAHTIDPVVSEVVSRHVVYNNSHFYEFGVMLLYFVSTIASSLFSSNKIINIFGVLTFLFAVISYWFYMNALVSVWCFFAATLSVLVFWHFKTKSVAVRLIETG